MAFYASDPHLTTDVTHDERFLAHVEHGWQADLTNFVQNGVPRIVFALILAFVFQTIVNFFIKRLNKRAEQMVGNVQRAGQLRTMAAIFRATSYGIVGFNSQITTVSNLSRDFAVGTLNVSVDAREDPDRVMAVLSTLAAQVREDEALKDIVIADPSILGVDKISGYEVVYPINVRVMVNQRDGVMRELRRRVLLAFNKEKIAFGSSNSTMIVQPPAPEPATKSTTVPASNQPSPSSSSPNVTS